MINNGLSSHYFNLTCGVRQGDPFSPYFFLLAIDILAIAVRKNEEIKGIEIEQEETKIRLRNFISCLINSINFLV